MVESLIHPRPNTSRRLRLEALEDRWSLGGAAYLDALLSVGSATSLSGVYDVQGKTAAIENGETTNASVTFAAGRLTENAITEGRFQAFETGDSVHAENRDVELTPSPTNVAGSEQFNFGTPPSSGTDAFDVQNGLSLIDSTASDIHGQSKASEAAFSGGSETAVGGLSNARNFNVTNAADTHALASTSEATNVASSADQSGMFLMSSFASVASNPASAFNGTSRFAAIENPQLAPDFNEPNALLITTQNRNSATMMGGWNPGLRSIMVMNDGSRWFAAEQGTNSSVNSAISYYRLGTDGWKKAGSVMLPAGIQQNMAMITNGRMIYAYGCTRTAVIEAWFDTAKPRWNLVSGNAISASGHAVNPGSEANYIGAAWHNKTRVVWWTNVGKGGSGGNWTYSYNRGGGWNGPIVSGLGGYNDVGYVRAQFDDRSRMRLVGESYRGQFPSGTRHLSSTTIKLGNAARWSPLPARLARSPLDLWQVDSSDVTQYLYETPSNKVGYSSDKSFAGNSTNFSALQARFISSRDRLGLVLAFRNSIEVRVIPRSEAAGFIDWNAIKPIRFDLPKSLKSAGVSAIWNVDESKQPNDSDRLEFAICGAFPRYDNVIYYYAIP